MNGWKEVELRLKYFSHFFSRYTSLPPSSVNMLSLLIESKVRLPQCFPLHNRATKRDLLKSQGEKEFFLSIVRDIATELDLKSLSHKVIYPF